MRRPEAAAPILLHGAAAEFAAEAADGVVWKRVKPMGTAKEEKQVKRQSGKSTSILIFYLLGPPRQSGKSSFTIG